MLDLLGQPTPSQRLECTALFVERTLDQNTYQHPLHCCLVPGRQSALLLQVEGGKLNRHLSVSHRVLVGLRKAELLKALLLERTRWKLAELTLPMDDLLDLAEDAHE